MVKGRFTVSGEPWASGLSELHDDLVAGYGCDESRRGLYFIFGVIVASIEP
jgi:hypothetical protein